VVGFIAVDPEARVKHHTETAGYKKAAHFVVSRKLRKTVRGRGEEAEDKKNP
jgi:hypothetical protein